MKLLRWLAAGLIWILGSVLGLVGVLLCITVVLLPLGIPILMLARRLFSAASALVLPRAVRHPVDELDRVGTEATQKLRRTSKRTATSGADSIASDVKGAYGKGKGVLADADAGKKARRLRRSVEKKAGRRNRRGFHA